MTGVFENTMTAEETAAVCDELKRCVRYLKEQGHLRAGAAVVLGCSTSEVCGGSIGHNSVPDVGKALARTMIDVCAEEGLYPMFQCCEHLNRALVMEQDVLDRLMLTQVNAVPYPKAGGSCAAAAYRLMKQPAVASAVQADAAIDVGDTLVGMHLKPVAVPLRLTNADGNPARVGNARVVMAYSRLPYIGGGRTRYSLEEE